MQTHNVQQKHPNKKKKLIGRGGSRGTYSGRGIKGQKAHAGRKIRPELRDIIKKIPKARGYRFPSIQSKHTTVDVAVLDQAFNAGDSITPDILFSKKIIRGGKGDPISVKILGKGPVEKKLTVKGFLLSKGARDAILKAGGRVE